MSNQNQIVQQIAELERSLKNHPDADIKNVNRLRTVPHSHTGAVCKAILALIEAFPDRKVVVIVEAEISELGWTARPEDIVAWIEHIGVLVIEVKSHAIEGIRRFENNVPQVVYQGNEEADVDLLDQPKNFAYKLKSELEKAYDEDAGNLPPLYYAGWLPNVSPEEVAARSATVAPDKVWLKDMLEPGAVQKRLSQMNNLTKGSKADRPSLERFCRLFGATSGLPRMSSPRPTQFASMGHLIDRKNLRLKKLTKEQEDLAFSPHLVRGPKVIWGVAGSGKTIVLANAVAEAFLRAMGESKTTSLFPDTTRQSFPQILVLCFNRALVPYISSLIRECFDARKPSSDWVLPVSSLKVMNIDRYAYRLTRQAEIEYDRDNVGKTVESLLKAGVSDQCKYKHVFIDEGQDLNLDWYPLIRSLAVEVEEIGRSIVIFYDDAQNLYGRKKPGDGGLPPWKDYLGAVPHPRGLNTIMRVGHRNTNQILSLSYNLLVGAFADVDPQMAEFAALSKYEKDIIPIDPAVDHPHAGKPCVERIAERQYRVHFAVNDGPIPIVHPCVTEQEMLTELVKEIERVIDPNRGNVDRADVLVMVPEKSHIEAVVKMLASRDIPAHVPVKLENQNKSVGKRKTGADPRDLGCFQRDKVTVSTIKSAKGYTAHVCHVAFVHMLDGDALRKETRQQNRAQLHVACTRSSLFLDLWGTSCSLMSEAEKARATLG